MSNSYDEGKTNRAVEAEPFLNEAVPKIAAPVNGHGLDNGTTKDRQNHEEIKRSSTRGICAQTLVAGAVFLLTTCNGVHIGYSAILVPQLQADNRTLSTDMEMGSWIASVQSVASPIGALLSGLVMDKWGRRISLILSSIPFTISWIIMPFASNHAVILSARAVGGLASGLAIPPTQVLIGEIAEPRIRGILTGTNFLSHSLGILLVYVLGAMLEWNTVAGISAVLPFLSCVCFIFLPESPVWLVRKGQLQRANRALLWLRGGQAAKEEVKEELRLLVIQYEAEKAVELRRRERNKNNGHCTEFCQPHVLKPFIIVCMFYVTQVLSGTFIVIFYAVEIIAQAERKSGLGIDRYMSAVLTGVTRLGFNLLACFLLLWIGRRPLAIMSGLLQALGAFSFGCFFYLKNVINLTDYEFPTQGGIILGSLLFFVAANTCGYFTLPGVAMGELLPGSIRGRAGGYILAATYMGFFITTKIFPWLCLVFGLHGLFVLFGIMSVIGAMYLYLFLPESSESSLAEIEKYFLQKNILWVGRNGCRGRTNATELPVKTEDYELQIRR